jgi:hypothetical protein
MIERELGMPNASHERAALISDTQSMKRSDFYTPRQVALLAGYSAKFIREEIRAGELKAEKWQSGRSAIGRWRVKVEDAKAYIARMRVAAMERSTVNTIQP